MTESLKPNIEIKELTYIYNQGKANEAKGLEDINLRIYPYEYVIIYGPSGCGKSTLLYTIAGFQKPSSGIVSIDNQDINALSKKEQVNFHRMKMGMVFQSFFLIPTLKVIDNVCLPKVFIGEDTEKRRTRGMEILNRFGIGEQAEKFPEELSGGQKQRVAIARALANNPDILIADEPVGNLDSKSAFNVMSILSELNEKDKKTIILVTHDPAHLKYGNKIVYMSDGKIVKIEEVVERKKAVMEGEEEILVKKEEISPELLMLMRSFKNFTPQQLGMLLIPFKAQEFISHVIFNMPEDQIIKARNKLQEVIGGRLKMEDFEKFMDEDEEKGGLGWDKRTAKRIISRVKDIMDISFKINMKNLDATAEMIANHLKEYFNLQLDQEDNLKLAQMIKLRLENQLSIVEFRRGLDRPKIDKGLGLNKHSAIKVARELEILLLARYSG